MTLFGRDPATAASGAARLVLVDDEPELRWILRSLLERVGCTVVAEAAEGAAGVAAVVEYEPDAVITDLRMPGVDGLDLARAIRATDQELPIVLLTAFADAATEQQAAEVGIDAVVGKDEDLAEVIPVLEAVLHPDRKRLQSR